MEDTVLILIGFVVAIFLWVLSTVFSLLGQEKLSRRFVGYALVVALIGLGYTLACMLFLMF
jgi:hypothetical protein